MKFRIALLALGMAAYGCAQTLVANIPFNFHVGDRTYASGRYYFSPGVAGVYGSVWVMRSRERHMSMLFAANVPLNTVTAPQRPGLVFKKYGNTCFLSQVWRETQGRQLAVSKSEKEFARSTPVAELVAVNLAP